MLALPWIIGLIAAAAVAGTVVALVDRRVVGEARSLQIASSVRGEIIGTSIAVALVLVGWSVVAGIVVQSAFSPLATTGWAPGAAYEWKQNGSETLSESFDRFALPAARAERERGETAAARS